MRVFGFDVTVRKAAVEAMTSGNTGGAFGGGWLNLIREPHAGGFQAGVVLDAPRAILAFSAVFSCVTIIARDISKLEINLNKEGADGICRPVDASPFLQVLTKPNRFQNRIQFISNWIVSKLLFGNTYALKERDGRGVVTRLYILDPQLVTPLVTDQGDVYYQLSRDRFASIAGTIVVPASEIIHDRMECLWHPLVGISPLFACGASATLGNRIQADSVSFFGNYSMPSGILTSPGKLDSEQAQDMKQRWQEAYGGAKRGSVAVLGNGLAYAAVTRVTADQAQLIEQLNWSVADVARAFHVPLYKLQAENGREAGTMTVEQLNQAYYSDCLQSLIESLELCLEEGLSLPSDMEIEVDEEGLLRMDTAGKATVHADLVKAGIFAPNEARAKWNLAPVTGGKQPYLQQQNYSLEALAKRDAQADPFAKGDSAAPPALPPSAANQDAYAEAAALRDAFVKAFA